MKTRFVLGLGLTALLHAALGSVAVVSANDDPPDERTKKKTTITSLRRDLEQRPDDPEVHRLLGIALRRSGKTDEAIRYLEQAVELASDDVSCLLSLSVAYSSGRRPEQAEATYNRLLAVSPKHPKALNNLGNIAIRRGDEQLAIELYRRAVEADGQYVMARLRLARLLRLYGRYEEATGVLRKLVTLEPSTPQDQQAIFDGLYLLGAVELALGNPEEADRILSEALGKVPNHEMAHYARAQALTQLGRQAEAEQELQIHMRLLELRPAAGPVATSR